MHFQKMQACLVDALGAPLHARRAAAVRVDAAQDVDVVAARHSAYVFSNCFSNFELRLMFGKL